MLVMLSGIDIELSELQPLKANQSRDSIPSSRTIRLTFFEAKASLPMPTTACPSITDGIEMLSLSVFIEVIVALYPFNV